MNNENEDGLAANSPIIAGAKTVAKMAAKSSANSTSESTSKIWVVYTTMSGNGEFIAKCVEAGIREMLGWRPAREVERAIADAAPMGELQKSTFSIFVIPTWGRGEIPAGAEKFYAALTNADEAVRPDLSQLEYGVVALGDRQYPDFCAAGIALDKALAGCGARRLQEPLMMDGIPVEKYRPDLERWLYKCWLYRCDCELETA